MRRRPNLRVTTESGRTWDDPTEDYLFILLEDIDERDEEFLILERLGDASGQTYIQCRRNDEGRYLIERREGGPDRHYWTTAPDMRVAHELIASWAYNPTPRASAARWTKLRFG
ncbi:hypothetical protein ESO86_13035 [Agromyces binzhouensis]|uniref:Uncharacterized protein n=2 Tax=Agromyces binzhouensis TaxID=1817495 RepID=A0A4Q2JIZ1_9MICO|nr:hypothetical protein ESO86_13035 [Agromyces binzhouensis]